MSKVDSLEKLQEVMVQSGRDVGLHDCLWANEFEISVVCKVLHICCLVWDTTAKSKTDMLLKVGEEEKDFIILKKVGEHYNLVYREDEDGVARGVFARDDLSEEALTHWGVHNEHSMDWE